MSISHYLSDAPQVKSHMVFLDDFHSGYSNMMDKINRGASVDALASDLRGESVPVNNSMNDYFYSKGQWAAIMDNK